MAMPKKVKAFQLFNEGIGKAGMVKNVTLPKLSRKFEEYRADIMDGPIEIDHSGKRRKASQVKGVDSAFLRFAETAKSRVAEGAQGSQDVTDGKRTKLRGHESSPEGFVLYVRCLYKARCST